MKIHASGGTGQIFMGNSSDGHFSVCKFSSVQIFDHAYSNPAHLTACLPAF